MLFTAPFNNTLHSEVQNQINDLVFPAVNHNYGDNQQTLQQRNKQNEYNQQMLLFEPFEVNFCFLSDHYDDLQQHNTKLLIEQRFKCVNGAVIMLKPTNVYAIMCYTRCPNSSHHLVCSVVS